MKKFIRHIHYANPADPRTALCGSTDPLTPLSTIPRHVNCPQCERRVADAVLSAAPIRLIDGGRVPLGTLNLHIHAQGAIHPVTAIFLDHESCDRHLRFPTNRDRVIARAGNTIVLTHKSRYRYG